MVSSFKSRDCTAELPAGIEQLASTNWDDVTGQGDRVSVNVATSPKDGSVLPTWNSPYKEGPDDA